MPGSWPVGWCRSTHGTCEVSLVFASLWGALLKHSLGGTTGLSVVWDCALPEPPGEQLLCIALPLGLSSFALQTSRGCYECQGPRELPLSCGLAGGAITLGSLSLAEQPVLPAPQQGVAHSHTPFTPRMMRVVTCNLCYISSLKGTKSDLRAPKCQYIH